MMGTFRRVGGPGPQFRYRRDAAGNIIAKEPIAGAGGGGKASDPLKLLRQVLKGKVKPGDLSKLDQKGLAKLDLGNQDLAKFGLSTRDQLSEFKAMFADLSGDKRLNKGDLKDLATFTGKAVANNRIAKLEDSVAKVVPGSDVRAEQRGRLAGLNLSIFARAAVGRARGVKAATATSPRGDANYGKSLARLSIGGMGLT